MPRGITLPGKYYPIENKNIVVPPGVRNIYIRANGTYIAQCFTFVCVLAKCLNFLRSSPTFLKVSKCLRPSPRADLASWESTCR